MFFTRNDQYLDLAADLKQKCPLATMTRQVFFKKYNEFHSEIFNIVLRFMKIGMPVNEIK